MDNFTKDKKSLNNVEPKFILSKDLSKLKAGTETTKDELIKDLVDLNFNGIDDSLEEGMVVSCFSDC